MVTNLELLVKGENGDLIADSHSINSQKCT